MLLARDEFPSPSSFAVFICGVPPFREDSLRDGLLQHVKTSPSSPISKLPTAHLISAQDEALPASLNLNSGCWEQTRLVYDHGGGHQVPVNPKGVTDEIANTIQQVIAKASLA